MNHAVGSSSCPASAAESEDCASWWPSGPALFYGGTFGSTTGALSEKRLPNPLRFHYLPSCFPMKVAASGGQLHFQTNLFDQERKNWKMRRGGHQWPVSKLLVPTFNLHCFSPEETQLSAIFSPSTSVRCLRKILKKQMGTNGVSSLHSFGK